MKIRTYIKNPKNFLIALLYHSHSFLSDKLCIILQYRVFVGRWPNLKNPKRFTEKIQWLKLYFHDPVIPNVVNKITAKDYVAKLIGEEHIVKTYGVWNNFDDIDFRCLSNKFVLKTNHTGGGEGIIVCNNKDELNKEKARVIINNCLKINMYNSTREWPYKKIQPKIIAEQLLEPLNGDCIRDYKIYCFNGVPRVILIASNRFSTHNYNFFDLEFNPLPIVSCCGDPLDASEIEKPAKLNEMIEIAKVLSAPFPHVRVDMYYTNDTVYFGELTFYDSSGYDNISSDSVDLLWGSWISLPSKRDCKNLNCLNN